MVGPSPPGDQRDDLRAQARRLPGAPGVYRFRDEAGEVLYVGKAKDLRKRVGSYLRSGRGAPVGRTAEMVALECIRCANCESGRGCPRGIATTDPELSTMYDSDWGSARLLNLFHSWAIQLQDILWRLGMKSVRELVGRSDLLVHLDYRQQAAGKR